MFVGQRTSLAGGSRSLRSLDERRRPKVVEAAGALDGHDPPAARSLQTLDAGRNARKKALAWAAKIAVACRRAQEVREFAFDPTVALRTR